MSLNLSVRERGMVVAIRNELTVLFSSSKFHIWRDGLTIYFERSEKRGPNRYDWLRCVTLRIEQNLWLQSSVSEEGVPESFRQDLKEYIRRAGLNNGVFERRPTPTASSN